MWCCLRLRNARFFPAVMVKVLSSLFELLWCPYGVFGFILKLALTIIFQECLGAKEILLDEQAW